MLDISIKAVRQSQRPLGGLLPIFFNFAMIPIAWPLTAILGSMGLGPNAATVIRIFLSFIGLVFFSCPSQTMHATGLALIMLGVVFDNVDGQLARVLDKASYYGKFFDGLVDSFFEVSLPFALGIYFLLASGRIDLFAAGAISGIALALLQITMIRCNVIELRVAAETSNKPQSHLRLQRFLDLPLIVGLRSLIEFKLPLLLWDFRYVGLIVGFLFGEEGLYLFTLCGIQLVHLIFFSALRLTAYYARFDIHRLSSSASLTGMINDEKKK
jgi:phosphatidylglycerophosphate synthase